jgi:hypothetical protein
MKAAQARTDMLSQDRGDPHNFGQSVQVVSRASGIYFQKPGKDSPLAGLFAVKNNAAGSLRDHIFNLEVEVGEDFSGISRQVETFSGVRDERALGHSLGVLLAYCYIFGIRDLHHHNLIRVKSHLQVIDAEVVLVKLLLPNETLLLPFKDIGPESAGIRHLTEIPAPLSAEMVSAILAGYCETFDRIESVLPEMTKVFAGLQTEMARVPVRHIARDTIVYRDWKTSSPKTPFFKEELEQLERGDIPYFFKFIGDPCLYQYADRSGARVQVDAPSEFLKAIARDATDPLDLLKQDRVEVLFSTGILFLAKRLLTPDFQGELCFGRTALSQEAGLISATVGGRRYQARREA